MIFETALIALSLTLVLHSKVEFKLWLPSGLYGTVAPRSELPYNRACRGRENNHIASSSQLSPPFFSKMSLSPFLPASVAFVSALLLAIFYAAHRHRSSRFPPGPRGTLLGGMASKISATEPWQQYSEWSRQYGKAYSILVLTHQVCCLFALTRSPAFPCPGPVMSFRVYNTRIVVLSSYRSIYDLLNGRASIYSDRPHSPMLHDPLMCNRGKTVFNISAKHPRHRKYRKLLQGGLSSKATKEYESLLIYETKTLVEGLAENPRKVEWLVRR